MAIVDHKPERSDPKPLLLGLGLLLVVVAVVGGVLYLTLRSPKPTTIKLSEEDAKKAGVAEPPIGNAPPFPPTVPLEQAPDPGATMITLDLKNATVAEAFAALAKQANVDIKSPGQQRGQGFFGALLAKRMDVSISNKPFWAAMQDLCKQANVRPYAEWNNRTQIALQEGSAEAAGAPVMQIGSSVLVQRDITSRFNADLMGQRAPNRSLDVYMTLYVDPKVKVYRISPLAVIEAAVDENGASLIRAPERWDEQNNGQGRSNWTSEIDCKLQFPANAGQKIAKLKGYCRVVLSDGKEEVLKIKDPLAVRFVDQKAGNQILRVGYVRKQGANDYQAMIQADSNSPVFKDWELFRQQVKLVDASGKAFDNRGGGWGGGQRTSDFYLYFGGEPGMSAPAELQITVPTGVRELRIPFELNDIPLPH